MYHWSHHQLRSDGLTSVRFSDETSRQCFLLVQQRKTGRAIRDHDWAERRPLRDGDTAVEDSFEPLEELSEKGLVGRVLRVGSHEFGGRRKYVYREDPEWPMSHSHLTAL